MKQSGDTAPKTRWITLKDGQYMIFYTFEDEHTPSPEDAQLEHSESEPKPQAASRKPQAEDECLV
jgi:hypothetical protein